MPDSDDKENNEDGSLRVEETQPSDPSLGQNQDEKEENCRVWAQNVLKTGRISKMTQEFRDHKKFQPGVTCAISEKVSEKNRYEKILCGDENRVVLKERDGGPPNDYINASWMDMPDGVRFISTQGPIQKTLADFWHMIFTEKCHVIVMLCQYVEDEQEKCQKYFGDVEEKYGVYRVKTLEKTSEMWNPVKYTQLEVRRKNVKHLVHHFWYYDWPDQIAPLDASPMIKLYKAALKKSDGQPIVVHCSAGVGRTATFVGIHLAHQLIRDNPTQEMAEVLRKLRKMRIGAIQSQLQYVFLSICVLQLFVDDKLISHDGLFEALLRRYADTTKKCQSAIEQEKKEQKERKRKEARRVKREREKEREKLNQKGKELEKEEEKDKEVATGIGIGPKFGGDEKTLTLQGKDRSVFVKESGREARSKYEPSRQDRKGESRYERNRENRLDKKKPTRPSVKKRPSSKPQ